MNHQTNVGNVYAHSKGACRNQSRHRRLNPPQELTLQVVTPIRVAGTDPSAEP
jgi:hypothetical protein